MASNNTHPTICYDVSDVCTVDMTAYGYVPSLAANVFFMVAFGMLCVTNLVLALLTRTWSYGTAMVFASLAPVIGYYGRVLLHYNVFHSNGFLIQVAVLIISPAFNSAAVYLTLKHITLQFGTRFSRINPAWYTYIFITCDLLSIMLQGVGGGIAAAAGMDNLDQMKLGDNIMLTGVCWQVICLALFAVLAVDCIWRRRKSLDAVPLYIKQRDVLRSLKFRSFASGVALAYIFILFRCIYRIAEMAGGWGSQIMRNEAAFIACEGVFILFATVLQTVFHPGYCFPTMSSKRSKSKQSTGSTAIKYGSISYKGDSDTSMPMQHLHV